MFDFLVAENDRKEKDFFHQWEVHRWDGQTDVEQELTAQTAD